MAVCRSHWLRIDLRENHDAFWKLILKLFFSILQFDILAHNFGIMQSCLTRFVWLCFCKFWGGCIYCCDTFRRRHRSALYIGRCNSRLSRILFVSCIIHCTTPAKSIDVSVANFTNPPLLRSQDFIKMDPNRSEKCAFEIRFTLCAIGVRIQITIPYSLSHFNFYRLCLWN